MAHGYWVIRSKPSNWYWKLNGWTVSPDAAFQFNSKEDAEEELANTPLTGEDSVHIQMVSEGNRYYVDHREYNRSRRNKWKKDRDYNREIRKRDISKMQTNVTQLPRNDWEVINLEIAKQYKTNEEKKQKLLDTLRNRNKKEIVNNSNEINTTEKL